MAAPVVADARRLVALPPATDWLLRPFEGRHAQPLWLGLGIAAVVVTGSLLARGLVDRETLLEYAGVDVLVAVIFGYVPAATAYLRRSAEHDYAELRPVLPGSDAEIEAMLRATVCPGRGALLIAGLVSAGFWGALPAIDPGFWVGGRPPLLSAPFLFHAVRQGAMGFLIGRAAVAEVTAVRGYARLGRGVRVDLLDLRPLRPFARRGLRSGFVWILCSSLVTLFWLGPATASANGPVIVFIGASVLVVFVACVSGVRASIRCAKERQLDRLRGEIRRESRALLAPGETAGVAPGDARLANLIALQGLIEHVHEWPFDAPVLLRFALLALLGLLSWLGSALVEHLLDVVLG